VQPLVWSPLPTPFFLRQCLSPIICLRYHLIMRHQYQPEFDIIFLLHNKFGLNITHNVSSHVAFDHPMPLQNHESQQHTEMYQQINILFS
jgi:hypothetical protein